MYKHLVPYNYPRSKGSRYKEMRDENKLARVKRYFKSVYLKPVRGDKCRGNVFKRNVNIRKRFSTVAYRNRWYN